MLEYTYEHEKIKVIRQVLVLEQKTTNPDSNLAKDLSQLNQEFATFNKFYACFCDTLAGVVVEDQMMDAGTVEGVSRCAHWMKHRMGEFSVSLQAIQKSPALRGLVK